MGLFRKQRPKVANEQIAGRIAKEIILKQSALASYLNSKAGRFKARTLGMWFIGFCTLFGCYCLYLIAGAVL